MNASFARGPVTDLLVANRGEIACRIIGTARRLGLRTIAVYSDADAGLPHVRAADAAVHIGPAPAAQSYLDVDRVLAAARETGANAIHPGYGFLSENADFARRVEQAAMVWVGPSPEVLELMGDKVNAREVMGRAGLPLTQGSAPLATIDDALTQADQIGYPVMLKVSRGGGGIGMAVVRDARELARAVTSAQAAGSRYFNDGSVFLERYLERVRHVEMQILGLPDGRIVVLGDRDCSVQRRHQKIVEETPSPGVGPELREAMREAARTAGRAVDYRGAGTIECLVDPATQTFTFMEMNTRLQVEHPITEMVTGIDIVEQQLRIARGDSPDDVNDSTDSGGCAVEFRLCAEDPDTFLPQPGRIEAWHMPAGADVRVDSGYEAGSEVTAYYDPLVAKICVWAPDRPTLLTRAAQVLGEVRVEGLTTNLPLLRDVVGDPRFIAGDYDTRLIETRSASAARP